MLFSLQLCWEDRADLFVQSPEFIGAHHCKIVVFHVDLQKCFLSLKDVSDDSMVQREKSVRWQLDQKA